MLQRLDTSGSNAPLHPGKVQNLTPSGTHDGKMPVGCPDGEVETWN